jgi:hypothetical protein
MTTNCGYYLKQITDFLRNSIDKLISSLLQIHAENYIMLSIKNPELTIITMEL